MKKIVIIILFLFVGMSVMPSLGANIEKQFNTSFNLNSKENSDHEIKLKDKEVHNAESDSSDPLFADIPKQKIHIRTKQEINRIVFQLFLDEFQEDVNESFLKLEKKADEAYFNFENVIVHCKRCHMAYEKGYILCSNCRANYHKPDFKMCFKCFNQTPEGKKKWLLKKKNYFINNLGVVKNSLLSEDIGILKLIHSLVVFMFVN